MSHALSYASIRERASGHFLSGERVLIRLYSSRTVQRAKKEEKDPGRENGERDRSERARGCFTRGLVTRGQETESLNHAGREKRGTMGHEESKQAGERRRKKELRRHRRRRRRRRPSGCNTRPRSYAMSAVGYYLA